MVDSVVGAGAPQNVSQIRNNQTQKAGGDRAVASSASSGAAPSDEVSLSSEALGRAEIDGVLAQTRAYLERDTDASLSNGQNLDALL